MLFNLITTAIAVFLIFVISREYLEARKTRIKMEKRFSAGETRHKRR